MQLQLHENILISSVRLMHGKNFGVNIRMQYNETTTKP